MFIENEKNSENSSLYGLNKNIKVGLSTRRFPRVFLSHKEAEVSPISGILLMLPNRTFVPIIGVSSVGLIIPTTGILGQIRIGQILDCKMKFAFGIEPILMKLKVMRLTADAIFLVLEGSVVESRLKIDQIVKDKIIFRNLSSRSPLVLQSQFKESKWWQGPFDTNFLSWSDSAGHLVKAIIEYDGLIFIFENKNKGPEWWLKKSLPNVDEVRGYAAPWIEVENQRICMGTSWRERLIRLMQASPSASSLNVFTALLKANLEN